MNKNEMNKRVQQYNLLGVDMANRLNQGCTVIDSPCGRGKTEFMLKYIPTIINRKIIYIVELLSEVDRVLDVLQPYGFECPKVEKGRGKKIEHLKKMLSEGKGIVTTHALLDNITPEILDILRQQEYTIILDEVHKVMEVYPINTTDLDMLLSYGIISVDEYSKVHWHEEKIKNMVYRKEYDGVFKGIKNLCEIGCLYLYANNMYVWMFPKDLFHMCPQVVIMTYLFESSIMSCYFKMFDIKYDKLYLNKERKLIEWKKEYQEEDARDIGNLINLYQGKLNYETGYTLSSSFFKQTCGKVDYKVIKNNVLNYFIHIIRGKSDKNMWTTIKSAKGKLQGKGYTKGFISLNMRASNDFREKENLAYIYNKYLNPVEKNFFVKRGISVDEDLYAISELLQWVFRSQIRDGKSINLYLPSYRMRMLLQKFIGDDSE